MLFLWCRLIGDFEHSDWSIFKNHWIHCRGKFIKVVVLLTTFLTFPLHPLPHCLSLSFLALIPLHPPPHYLSPSFLCHPPHYRSPSSSQLLSLLPPPHSYPSFSLPLSLLPLSHPHHLYILHSFQSATSLPLLFPVILSSTSLPLSFFRLHPPY